MSRKLELSHLQAWRFFLTASTKIVNNIDTRLREANQIPLNWYDLLIELHEAPERRLRMSELAERVLLTRSGLTRLVDRLEEEGYLTRELDPEDRRSFYAIITENGVKAVRHAWPIYAEGISELFGQHLSDTEADVLTELILRMLAGLKEG